MSAKLESTYNDSPDLYKARPKLPQFVVNTSSINYSTSQQEQTQRFRPNKLNQNSNNIFLKETQRYCINSHINSPVLLTQQSSSSHYRSFGEQFFEQNNQNDNEINGIEQFLKQYGMMQLFDCFESFRSKLIDVFSQQDKSQTRNGIIDLLQAITNIKSSLASTSYQSSPVQTSQYEIKELLLTISNLRKDNDVLREKTYQLSRKLRQFTSQFQIENSIINNSISVGSSSITSKISYSQQSDDSNFQQILKIKIQPFQLIAKNGFTSSLQNSVLNAIDGSSIQHKLSFHALNQQSNKSKAISQHSSFYLQQKQPFVLNCPGHDQWKVIIEKSVVLLKDIFKKYFSSANLALRDSKKCSKLKQILKNYKNFKSNVQQQTEEVYLRESSRLMDVIKEQSHILSQLVSEQINIFKSRQK